MPSAGHYAIITNPALRPELPGVQRPAAVKRQSLALPHAADVDFRASCFCHKRLIDMGFVCSVRFEEAPAGAVMLELMTISKNSSTEMKQWLDLIVCYMLPDTLPGMTP